MTMMHRRQLLTTTAGAVALATLSLPSGFVQADDKLVTIGIGLPLTDADADSATRIKNGALMAIEEVNGKGGVGGYKIRVTILDSGTATAGQYDPAQAATNT